MGLLRLVSMLAAVTYLLTFAPSASADLTPEIVHQFPLGTWVENLALRSTKPPTILATILTSPQIYVVDPESKFEPVQLAYFPGYLGVWGITELRKDVFYVVTGNNSVLWSSRSFGNNAVWEVDLRGVPADVGTASPKLKEIAKFPKAGILNGITVLNPVEGMLLISDSLFGCVWSLNVNTGEIAVSIQDTSMNRIWESPETIGVNGVHVIGEELYYTNTNFQTFNRISIDIHTGQATGPPLTLAWIESISPDDFAVDFKGNVWIASNMLHQGIFLKGAALPGTTRATTRATIEIMSGNTDSGDADASATVGWSSVAFGISKKDVRRGRLYIATTGGVPEFAGENLTTGGTISRVDVGCLQ